MVPSPARAEPVVLLPFPVADVPGAPPGLRYAVSGGVDPPPYDPNEVRFVVPAYGWATDPVAAISRLPALEVVQLPTAGYEHVLPAIRDGVTLCNARGVHDASTAELAVGLMIASLRRLDDHLRDQAARHWPVRPDVPPSLADRRVLILGYGSVGAAIERRLSGFEVQITRVATRAREGVHAVDELPRLLPSTDVLVVVVPLTEQTRGLLDAQTLALLPDGALVVNVARGAVVSTEALLAEAQSGRLRAALDVTDPEPLPPDHPLWSTPGVLITPHVGGVSTALMPRLRALVGEQLRRYAAGQPLLNVVRVPPQ